METHLYSFFIQLLMVIYMKNDSCSNIVPNQVTVDFPLFYLHFNFMAIFILVLLFNTKYE